MIIESIEAVNTKKKKVRLDDGRVFALYNSEIYRCRLKEGLELTQEQYQELLDTILIKRARARLMNLIKNRDYTEYQIRMKLKQSLYPDEAVEEALSFGREYHYLDDLRYASCYVRQQSGRLSRRMLSLKLSEKGIPKELAEKVLTESEDSEEEALDGLMRKKKIEFSGLSREERQKIFAYFMRKGFSYENILKKINEFTATEHLT